MLYEGKVSWKPVDHYLLWKGKSSHSRDILKALVGAQHWSHKGSFDLFLKLKQGPGGHTTVHGAGDTGTTGDVPTAASGEPQPHALCPVRHTLLDGNVVDFGIATALSESPHTN